MFGWLIYAKKDADKNKSYIDWFINEARKQDITLQLIYQEQISIGLKDQQYIVLKDNKQVKLPNFSIVRTIDPLIQQIFQLLNIPTFNSFEVAQLTNHKSWTYIEMKKLGIPLLPTFFMKRSALASRPPLAYPFIVKEATGRGGQQVYMIESEKQWDRLPSILEAEDLVVQSADVQLGKDLRVFVIGKEIIAAVLRKNERDFRANFTLGGTAQLYYLSVEERSLVEKIVQHFDFGLVGIDFLMKDDGRLIFNEIEDVVGSRILSATTEINLLEKYVSFIKERVKKNVSREEDV